MENPLSRRGTPVWSDAAALRSVTPQRRITSQSGSGGSAHSPLYLLLCLLPRPAVPRLEESNELFGFALNAIELIVRQLTPVPVEKVVGAAEPLVRNSEKIFGRP
jgi:hypothetical protein